MLTPMVKMSDQNREASAYLMEHARRLNATHSRLSRYLTTGSSIAIIGLSSADVILATKHPDIHFTFVLPDANFRARTGLQIPENGRELFANLTEPLSDPRELFDTIIFTEVLEHLMADDELVLSNLYRLMNPGGRLIMSIPNAATFGNRAKLLMGYNIQWPKKRILRGPFGGYGHFREYTLKEIVQLLEPLFIIEEIRGVNGYRRGLSRLINVLPKTYANTLLVIAQRRDT